MVNRRIIRLEACRGLAALAVVVGHIISGFAPTIGEVLPGTQVAESLAGTVFFVAINGQAAVIFFFVLSGYVLTFRFFESPNPDDVMVAAIKRLPRLALLTTIATVGSAVIWLLGLYYFRQAAQITNSAWLGEFAHAKFPDHFQISIIGALLQGMWRTFIVGDNYYDTSLWTMAYEFHGSLVVFVAAPFIVFVLRNRYVWLSLIFSIVIFRYAAPYMVPFLSGMAIAYYRKKCFWFASPFTTGALLLFGIYLLGFVVEDRDYAIFSMLSFWGPAAANTVVFRVFVYTLGAMCVIVAILQSQVAERILDNKFGALLGRLSFPIYLVHVPVILSASSAAYIGLLPIIGSNAVWATGVCTVVLTFAISWPLARVDVMWVRFLNNLIRNRSLVLLSGRQSGAAS